MSPNPGWALEESKRLFYTVHTCSVVFPVSLGLRTGARQNSKVFVASPYCIYFYSCLVLVYMKQNSVKKTVLCSFPAFIYSDNHSFSAYYNLTHSSLNHSLNPVLTLLSSSCHVNSWMLQWEVVMRDGVKVLKWLEWLSSRSWLVWSWQQCPKL